MAPKKRSPGQRGGPPGCLFWLLLLCIVLLLFLINLGKIKETLARTNFNEIVSTQKKADGDKTPPVQPAPKVEADPAKEPVAQPQDKAPSPAKPQADAPAPKPKVASPAPSPKTDAPKASVVVPSQPDAAPQAARKRSALLYFVKIDEDGVMVRQEVKRQINASDQPLTDALAALLGGPSEGELRKNLVSLIPQGTKLLSAQVRGSTVFLNFNEAFMYNHYGIEGYAGQLKQVVYTATAFSTVHDVQILIEGERHDYLGGEGVYIGKPLSRNSF